MIPTEFFRRIALTLEGAVEGAHMKHPDFRVHGKIFATIYPDNRRGMVKLTPDLQREYIRHYPGMFEPASGAWGRRGCTTVNFSVAEAEIVRAAMTHAWRNTVRSKPGRKRTRADS
jgi:hypothetical protein